MAAQAKKGPGGDRGNPMLKAVEGEVLAPTKKLGTTYREAVNRVGDRAGRPRLIRTREELIDMIEQYLNGLVDNDGKYLGAPSLRGLGAFLGYSSPSWYRTISWPEVIGHFRLWVEGWRMDKVAVPRGGINPAGIMFVLANGLDKEEEEKTVTPLDELDDRPADAATLIETVWRDKDG